MLIKKLAFLYLFSAMLFKFKKNIIFILQFSAYGLAAAFLFLFLTPDSLLKNVNVYATRLYQEKELSVFQNPSLQNLFGIPPGFKKIHQNSSIGSGVIMNKEGYILTNAHVVQGAQNIGVTLNSGIQLKAKLIGLDADTDLAVIKIKLKNPPKIPIGDSELNLFVTNQWVFIFIFKIY